MDSNKGLFKHRFSQRLILMFLGCAMVPILTLAAIAYTSVKAELVAQSRSSIGRAAKSHAIGVHDRLLSLQNQLQLIRLTLTRGENRDIRATLRPIKETLEAHFEAIDYHVGGSTLPLLEAGPLTVAAMPTLRPQDDPPRATITLRKAAALSPPAVIMSLPMDDAGGATARLEAEITPVFLWGLGHANTLPARTDLVVIDDGGETLLNTSGLDILTLKANLRETLHNRNQGLRYTENGVDYHVSAWPLFLEPQFGIGTWRVCYLQAEAVVLAPIHTFKRSFLLILLLTLWVVLLLSLRHIRRAVVPLRRLHAGTRQLVAGNYAHAIPVEGRDEFAQVSAAFNKMSARIGRQMRGLRTLAEIGRETAAVFGVTKLIRIEMDLMARHLDFDKGLVLLASPDRRTLYCAGHYGFDSDGEATLEGLRLDLAPHGLQTYPDLRRLFADGPGRCTPLSKRLPSSPRDASLDLTWIPIVYEKTAYGLLGVSAPDGEGTEEDLLGGIAAQTALALHGAMAFNRLARSEARFRDIFASAASGMALLCPEGGFREVNQRLQQITGYAESALEERTLKSLLTRPAERSRLDRRLADLTARPETLVMEEFRLQHAEGKELWGLVSLSAYYGEGDEAGNFIVQLMDLTRQKQAEAERQAMAEQLQQAQKMEAIGTLAGGIAHDFNNILGGIMGFAQLGCMTAKAEDDGDKFAKIMSASKRAKDLVQQILTFSRQHEQSRQAIRIDLILKEALKLLRASIPSHIEMKRYIPVIETCVLADGTQMHQIIMNLCTNAYHAMEENGGRLTVNLRRHTPEAREAGVPAHLWRTPCLELTIGDTGCGMDSDTLTRIFDPYFTTKPQGKGTGLGLSVVHGIVESHEGGLQVTSTPGEGTTFRLLFPEMAAAAEATEQDPVPRTGAGEHVLLVDDEAFILDMASEMLTTLGYLVTTCLAPEEALDHLRREPDGVDLVITDLAMPTLKGDDLARAIHDLRPDLPVILCTGFNDPDQRCADADRLFSGLLSKPFSARELQEVVQDALST